MTPQFTPQFSQIHIEGLRVIENLTLDLQGLTVLIGENGTGKSTILEAFELLRRISEPGIKVGDALNAHGGYFELLKRGAEQIVLRVALTSGTTRLEYQATIFESGHGIPVISEQIAKTAARREVLFPARASSPTVAIDRSILSGSLQTEFAGKPLVMFPAPVPVEDATHPELNEAVRALARLLRNAAYHPPFETRPLWQQRELDVRSGPRWPSALKPAPHLSRYAANLPCCFQHLRNAGQETWARVIERIQLGISPDFRDFRITPTGRGEVDLELVFAKNPDKPLPAYYLSEGQLAYLAFVALVELQDQRSLLLLDEPELHLHPGLLARVIGLLEEASQHCPVLIATHSDRLLDCLSAPAQSVVLCELDEQGSCVLKRPEPATLDTWLKRYNGLGSLRAEGYEAMVFDSAIPAKPSAGKKK